MGVNLKDLESILISKGSAALFAVFGVSVGSYAYLQYKVPTAVPVVQEIKDTRDPVAVDREKRLAKAHDLVERRLYKNAEEILTPLYTETPKNPHLLSMLSLCEKKIGQLQNAETHLREAIEIEPGQWILHSNLGNLLFDRGKPTEAIESFKKALELSPKNFKVLLSQGKVQEMIGKFTEARLSYGRALEGGQMDAGTSDVVRDRLKRLDVLAFIERGDK